MKKIILIVLWVALERSAFATTYHVNTSGSNANSCATAQSATPGSAKLTIQAGVNCATVAGDIVIVADGSYTESVSLGSDGSSGSHKKLLGYSGASCPTTVVSDVNHPTGTRPNSGVSLTGQISLDSNYWDVNCFHIIHGSAANQVFLTSPQHDALFTNLELESSGTGGEGIKSTIVIALASYVSNIEISNSYIHGQPGGITVACSTCNIHDNEIKSLMDTSGGSDLDYVVLWGNNTVVRHNYMHENTINACFSGDCHMDCIQTFNTTNDGRETSKNITFDRNMCFNHHEGVIVQDGGNGDISNWTVTNNVFAFGPWDDGSGHTGTAGTAHIWCWVFDEGAVGTNVFYNNTCVNTANTNINGTGNQASLMGFHNLASGTASMKDNLWYDALGGITTEWQLGGGGTATGANNLMYSTVTSQSAQFSGDIVNQDPKLTSVGSNTQHCVGCNFRILTTSAAKDAGVSTSPTVTVDLDGTARPQGSAYDIGAFEFVSCTPSQVAFTSQPSNATIGVSLGTVVVNVQDSGNNNCTGDTSTITIANKAATCTGMTLSGTASGGNVFTTSNLTENAPGVCTLHATDGALTAADSNSFTVSSAVSSAGKTRLRK